MLMIGFGDIMGLALVIMAIIILFLVIFPNLKPFPESRKENKGGGV